jgi:hypothetical protein
MIFKKINSAIKKEVMSMKNFKKISVIISLFIMQTPLISGPLKDLKDTVKGTIEAQQQKVEEAIKKEATEINQTVSQTWAQWLIEMLGLDRAEQVAQVIDLAAAGAKKEISPEAANIEKKNQNK